MNLSALKSLASRAGWTALEAGAAVVTVDAVSAVELPAEAYVLPILATLLSMAKSFIASKVGDPETVEFS